MTCVDHCAWLCEDGRKGTEMFCLLLEFYLTLQNVKQATPIKLINYTAIFRSSFLIHFLFLNDLRWQMLVPLILMLSPIIEFTRNPPNTFYLEFNFMCLQGLFNINISVTKLKMKGEKDNFSPLNTNLFADRARLEVRNPFSLIINHAPIV